MIALGDVIDYWPDSRGVLSRPKALGQQTDLVLLTAIMRSCFFASSIRISSTALAAHFPNVVLLADGQYHEIA